MGDTLFSRMTDAGRVYQWKGDDYVSVTTAIKNGIAKPGLVGWAARTVAGIAVNTQKDEEGQYRNLTVKELMDAFDSSRGVAASVGNTVHSIAEKISNGEQVDIDGLSEEVQPFVRSFISFVETWKPEFIETEAFVASKKHGYAGTLDAIVRIGSQSYVLDIKTGKNIYPEVGLQMAAYARADFIGKQPEQELDIPSLNMNRGLVLHIRPEKFSLHPVMIGDEVFDTFLSALDIHNYSSYLKHYIVGPKWQQEDSLGQ